MAWGYRYDGGGNFPEYVPVAERRARAQRELAQLAKKGGRAPAPVIVDGRAIASTFWGKAWNENLERYQDYANRLPRGRTYVRNRSVVDLAIEPGKVTARVAGSQLYTVEVEIKKLTAGRWKALVGECTGKIASLIALVRGDLGDDVLAVLTRKDKGLFPTPAEISMTCSCPDVAGMCKHIAASLYGVGARLDTAPELFFALRQVNQADLITAAPAAVLGKTGASRKSTAKTIAADQLASIFGIELDAAEPEASRRRPRAKKLSALGSEGLTAETPMAPGNPESEVPVSLASLASLAVQSPDPD